jgi:hypothetical protein
MHRYNERRARLLEKSGAGAYLVFSLDWTVRACGTLRGTRGRVLS